MPATTSIMRSGSVQKCGSGAPAASPDEYSSGSISSPAVIDRTPASTGRIQILLQALLEAESVRHDEVGVENTRRPP